MKYDPVLRGPWELTPWYLFIFGYPELRRRIRYAGGIMFYDEWEYSHQWTV